MTMEEQIKQAFRHLNAFKRFRALTETAREKQKSMQEIERLELQAYKSIDQLELQLRGIQRENREITEEAED